MCLYTQSCVGRSNILRGQIGLEMQKCTEFERMMSSAREGRPTLILDFSTSPLHVKLNEQWGVRIVPGDQHDCWPHSSLPGATQQSGNYF